MTYTEKLKHPLWQKKRLEIFNRDKWACKMCGDEKTTLHVHHLKYTADMPHDEDSKNLVTCCEHCHGIIEYYKDNFEIIRLKKHVRSGEVLFIIQDSKNHIHFEVFNTDEGSYYEVFNASVGTFKEWIKFFKNNAEPGT